MDKFPHLPALRQDLEVIITSQPQGHWLFIVKDPISEKIFELREEDYFICKQLDGKTTLAQIQLAFKSHFNFDLDMNQLKAFITYLTRLELLIKDTSVALSSFSALDIFSPETWKKWNLFDPQSLLHHAAITLHWCYKRTFVVTSVVIFLLAINIAYRNFYAFLRDIERYFFSLPIIKAVAVYYLCFNIPSQIVKGITSSRYGSSVNECGVRLVFNLLPSLYCNYNFDEIGDKNKRSWVLFSPLYFLLLVTSIAILCWKVTPSEFSFHRFGIIVAATGIINAAIGLNIFWPTDGSYLLSHWLDIKDLRNRAIEFMKAWLMRRPLPEPLTAKNRTLFIVYGLSSKAITILSVALGAYFLINWVIDYHKGAGVLIIITAAIIIYREVLLMWLKGIWKNAKALIDKYKEGFPKWLGKSREAKITQNMLKKYKGMLKKYEDPLSRKKFLRNLLIKALIIFIIFPYRFKPGAAFRIQPIIQQGIRVKVAGQIDSILVEEGTWVKKGDLIAQLSKREIKKDLEATKSSLDEARANLKAAKLKLTYSQQETQRAQELYKKEQISTQEYENKQREFDLDNQALQARIAEADRLQTLVAHYEENLALTDIRSPAEGRIVSPYIKKKLDQALEVGDLLATVEDNRSVIAEIDLPEYDIGEVKVGMQVYAKTWAYSGKAFTGKVIDIAPVTVNREEAELQRAALEQERGAVRVLNSQEEEIVRVTAELPNPKNLLKAGMTGFAKIKGRWLPLGLVLTKGIVRFFRVEVWSWLP